jgi:hypothetical protein
LGIETAVLVNMTVRRYFRGRGGNAGDSRCREAAKWEAEGCKNHYEKAVYRET